MSRVIRRGGGARGVQGVRETTRGLEVAVSQHGHTAGM